MRTNPLTRDRQTRTWCGRSSFLERLGLFLLSCSIYEEAKKRSVDETITDLDDLAFGDGSIMVHPVYQ